MTSGGTCYIEVIHEEEFLLDEQITIILACNRIPESTPCENAACAHHCPRPALHCINKSFLTEELTLNKEGKAVPEIFCSSAEQ